MLESRGPRVEIRPQVVLQVLAHLEDHNPLQGHRLPPALHHQLCLVDFPHQLRIQRPPAPARHVAIAALAGDEPIGRRDLCEAVALDLRQGDGAGEGRAGLRLGGLVARLVGRRRRRLDGVLGDAVALEVVGAGSVHSGHFGPARERERRRRRVRAYGGGDELSSLSKAAEGAA